MTIELPDMVYIVVFRRLSVQTGEPLDRVHTMVYLDFNQARDAERALKNNPVVQVLGIDAALPR